MAWSMGEPAVMSFEDYAAEQLVRSAPAVARRWLERIAGAPEGGGPDGFIVSGITEVLRQVAEFVRTGQAQTLTRDTSVAAAMGAYARSRQTLGREPAVVLRELDLLARELDGACLGWIRESPAPPGPEAVLRAAGRLNRAPILMGEICIEAYRGAAAGDGAGDAAGADSDGLVPEPIRDFADMLVHELGTPLHSAAMAAQILSDPKLVVVPTETRRLAEVIQRNVRRVGTVLRDVQALALSGDGGNAFARPVAFGQALSEVMAEVSEEAKAAGVRIDVEEPIPPTSLEAAPLKIVLVNLIRNAIRYSDPARETRWVRIGFEQTRDGAWTVRVRDNGLGIPAEQHAALFDRFTRGNTQRAGTGLGLAIARRAAQHLGGQITFESVEGVGSTFRFSVPSGD